MTAGRLDRLVQFQRATLSDDGFGQVETFADYGDPYFASKTDVSDAERWRAGEVAATVTTRFVVRSCDFTRGLTPKDRISCEGRVYDIFGIKEVGRLKLLEITAGARIDK